MPHTSVPIYPVRSAGEKVQSKAGATPDTTPHSQGNLEMPVCLTMREGNQGRN